MGTLPRSPVRTFSAFIGMSKVKCASVDERVVSNLLQSGPTGVRPPLSVKAGFTDMSERHVHVGE